ncbi:uncharacterized protein LOC107474476 [Arachis duranensis]|uniref:Uncharacterized protein LOC107474476 n=1 Tax=Arachis duranensis TaxID=130453 RepID=A0A9C6TBZ8_ARADU|nr:uncharacterized protein LOC107474476 [Arachis duranensis]
MPPLFDSISKIHPPREAWRLKVRVLRTWIVPSFGNLDVANSIEIVLVDGDSNKIQAIVKKQLINRFKENVISLLTSVGEEKEYVKDAKVMKMIVLELSSKELTIRYALFEEYVDEVHRFLSSGYMELPVVVIQLVKVKFFRGQVGLQNVMHATRLFFNPDLSEVVDFKNSMIDQGINRTQSLFIANEGKGVSLEDDFMRLTRRCTIDKLHDNNEVYWEGSFVIFGFVRSIVDEGPWFEIQRIVKKNSRATAVQNRLKTKKRGYLILHHCKRLTKHDVKADRVWVNL